MVPNASLIAKNRLNAISPKQTLRPLCPESGRPIPQGQNVSNSPDYLPNDIQKRLCVPKT
jgi:hypothetical protein